MTPLVDMSRNMLENSTVILGGGVMHVGDLSVPDG